MKTHSLMLSACALSIFGAGPVLARTPETLLIHGHIYTSEATVGSPAAWSEALAIEGAPTS